MLQFKWESYAAVVFNIEFLVFMAHLVFVCAFSFGASLTSHLPLSPDSGDDEEDNEQFLFSALTSSAAGVLTLGTLPFALIGSALFMSLELRQLLIEGLGGPWRCVLACALAVHNEWVFTGSLL
jgi:hypothetical protein